MLETQLNDWILDSDDDDMDARNEYYDNLMTDADIQTLFAESDDSDFEGFE